MIDQSALKEALSYNPEDGVFVWKKSLQRYTNGRVAGSLNMQGYRRISIAGRFYNAHRLAWFYVHGVWPQEIDHINRVRDDNRLANLRAADRFVNTQNQSLRKDNKSGIKGVSLNARTQQWRAQIKANHRSYFLGSFSTPEAASQAYQAAKARLHAFEATQPKGNTGEVAS